MARRYPQWSPWQPLSTTLIGCQKIKKNKMENEHWIKKRKGSKYVKKNIGRHVNEILRANAARCQPIINKHGRTSCRSSPPTQNRGKSPGIPRIIEGHLGTPRVTGVRPPRRKKRAPVRRAGMNRARKVGTCMQQQGYFIPMAWLVSSKGKIEQSYMKAKKLWHHIDNDNYVYR